MITILFVLRLEIFYNTIVKGIIFNYYNTQVLLTIKLGIRFIIITLDNKL